MTDYLILQGVSLDQVIGAEFIPGNPVIPPNPVIPGNPVRPTWGRAIASMNNSARVANMIPPNPVIPAANITLVDGVWQDGPELPPKEKKTAERVVPPARKPRRAP